MRIEDLARRHRAAQAEYEKQFREYLAENIPHLNDDRFWELQDVFRQEVVHFRFGYGRSNGIEQAAGELFRKPLADDFQRLGSSTHIPISPYTLQEALRFAKTWRGFRDALYQPLFDVITDRGDDSYGDLLDALPLAGRDVTQRALGRQFGTQQQFEDAVREACQGSPQLAELILHGENYIAASLSEAGREYFAIAAEG